MFTTLRDTFIATLRCIDTFPTLGAIQYAEMSPTFQVRGLRNYVSIRSRINRVFMSLFGRETIAAGGVVDAPEGRLLPSGCSDYESTGGTAAPGPVACRLERCGPSPDVPS